MPETQSIPDTLREPRLPGVSREEVRKWYALMHLGRVIDDKAPNYLKQGLGWSYHAPAAGHDAIQLALRERRVEMDLGGADVPGARRRPEKGEPMYGLYEHKRGFGAEWIEQVGAHERVIRPWRYRLGRAAFAIGRVTRRGDR